MRESRQGGGKTLFDYKKTLLDNKGARFNSIDLSNNPQYQMAEAMDDTRSMKSEFDYTTKKKFVEMVSSIQKPRFRLPQ